jgi:hypothetical protein
MKPSNLTHWCLLHLPTLPSFQKKVLFILFFAIWHPLSTDLLTYLLTDLVTCLLTCLVPRKQLHLVQRILFWKKNRHFTFISLNPTLRKTPSSHPRNNSLKKKGEKKVPQPFILRNSFEEIIYSF